MENMVEVKKNRGVEVKPLVDPDVVRENLERIGIVNRLKKRLYPSCYMISEGDKYIICHFKDLLKVPGMDAEDESRRNTIIWLFQKWGLIKIIDPPYLSNISKKKLFILSKEQKIAESWEIVHKFHLDNLKKENN